MDKLYALLTLTELPFVYNHFKKPPEPPYIVYLFANSDNFGADDKVYVKLNNYQVELYSKKKDQASEEIIEGLFDENEIFYDKSEVFIESEGLYQVMYEIQI